MNVPFSKRASSDAWETVSLLFAPQCFVEIQVKPSRFSVGLVLRIPDGTFQQLEKTTFLNLRRILESASINPAEVIQWEQFGETEPGMNGWNPAFEQVVLRSPDGSKTEVFITMAGCNTVIPASETTSELASEVSPMASLQPQSSPPKSNLPVPSDDAKQAGNAGDTGACIRGIDADWRAVLQMEKQLLGLRNKLVQTQTALNSLNRDLTGNESLNANSKDRKDWQQVRRWLRDSMTKISCGIRDHDIGATSGAERRDWFERMYSYVVTHRQPVENLASIQHDFMKFRKQVLVLSNSLNAIEATAQRDGIGRANRLLNKIRSNKNKKR